MAALFTEIVIDSRDPKALAEFWAAVLDWPLTENSDHDGTIYWLSRTGKEQDGPLIVFVPNTEPKTVKNRIHLDVNPLGCTQAEELERLIGLGAVRADIGQGEVPWVVLRDPEDNEFCLLGRTIPIS
jgi:hypothetical protein